MLARAPGHRFSSHDDPRPGRRILPPPRGHCAWTWVLVAAALVVGASARAGDLQLGQVLLGRVDASQNGSTPAALTHVDLETGEQHP